MLLITIEKSTPRKQYLHESGPLVLGRQPGGDEAHIVIDDDYVSRRHLVLEEVSTERVRFENVGRNNLELPDGTKLGQGACGEIELPRRLRIGRTVIDVTRQQAESLLDLDHPEASDGEEFQTLGVPATRQLPSVKGHSLASLGEVPSAEELTGMVRNAPLRAAFGRGFDGVLSGNGASDGGLGGLGPRLGAAS